MNYRRIINTLTIVVFLIGLVFALTLQASAQCTSCGSAGAKPATGGCGSGCGASGGCGSGCGAASAKPQQKTNAPMNLTPAQTRQLAAIDSKSIVAVKQIQMKLTVMGKELEKLIDDPKSNDNVVKTKMYEYAKVQADLQLTQVFAGREKNKVYTPAQKAIMTKSSSSCGCGGGANSGGCGAGCGG